jgi:hypothetical protein
MRIKIEDIYILNYPDIFILTEPAIPFSIDAFDTETVKIEFTPKDNVFYYDTLIFEITEPCRAELKVLMAGKGDDKINIQLWLPDTTVYIGDPDFMLPIFAEVETIISNPLFIDELILHTSHIYKLFLAERHEDCIRVNNMYDNENQLLELQIKPFFIQNDTTIIARLGGNIFLSEYDETYLRFDSLNVNRNDVIIDTVNGSLKTHPICIRRLRQIMPQEIMNAKISPNPFEFYIDIDIELSEKSLVEIIIVDPVGNILESICLGELSKGKHLRKISGRDLSEGVYFININSSENSIFKKIIKIN